MTTRAEDYDVSDTETIDDGTPSPARGDYSAAAPMEAESQDVANEAVGETDVGADEPGTPVGNHNHDGYGDSDPDETPSIQSTPSSSLILPTRISISRNRSSTASPSPARPFDRRFHARASSSASSIPRIGSPGGPILLKSENRRISMLSQFTIETEGSGDTQEDEEQRPWEVMKWSKLKRVSTQAFSEAGKRTFGRPTFLTVGAFIAIGTKKGLILLFDYQQTLKSIVGQGTPAAESGAITSLAISADHSMIAAGHASGSIYTWELGALARPFLAVQPMTKSSLSNRKADGHIQGSAVLHVGFLGQRRTALVSADDHGMAFSHLASRGLGAVARTVKTTRLLGRYPELSGASAPRKPSSVLGFASLPLGNVERLTDDVGLTAILTPFLLVIVSTTPIAQTQFKMPREKNIDPHSAMTGCLAWFPAVKLAAPASKINNRTSKSKLVYCWSHMLSVLDVDEVRPPVDEPEKLPTFNFTPRSQWRSEEAIAAVQWLSRSVLAVLTVSQRLIILEDHVMRIADSSDLNSKHIYHQDLFSHRLRPLVDKHEDGENSMHGVTPDAFHMSFKAYKGRLFLLGSGDVSMGILANWEDRLQALVDKREYLMAVRLATTYYTGDTERVTIGLPEDNGVRHEKVGKKVLEITSAALQHFFNEDFDDNEKDFEPAIRDLVQEAFQACLTIDEKDFLFDTVYEYYSDASRQDMFLYTLEPYILRHEIDLIPPQVMKDLLIWYASNDLGARLEDIICAVQPFTIDIDQVTAICKALELYDALAYVWSQAIGDYITPLIELLRLIQDSENNSSAHVQQERAETAVSKLFPFLAYTLTGRRYPDGAELSDYDAAKAKASVYGFLFSAQTVRWPRRRGELVLTQPDGEEEPPYPYIQALLHFDTDDFLSMLNEAFEDPFLNGSNDQLVNGITASELREEAFGLIVNRQRLTNILLEVMRRPEFNIEERLYLDIFIARNISKFSQFILLPGTVIRQVLIELCQGGDYDMGEECQLSVEYLLSIYQPSEPQALIEAFTHARFYRILKSLYKNNRQYAKWLETHFEDSDSKHTVFTAIAECLKSAGLNQKQTKDVKDIIVEHSEDLAEIDTPRTVMCLQSYAPDLLKPAFDRLKGRSQLQYIFLETVYEPAIGERDGAADVLADKHVETYVRLMCQYNPGHVADYVSLLKSGDLHLNNVLPAMEVSGVIDAAVILLARDGLVQTAMSRLIRHLSTLETAIVGLLDALNKEEDDLITTSTDEAITDLLDSVQKYVKLGIWLCQGQAQSSKSNGSPRKKTRQAPISEEVQEEDLAADELLWLDFLSIIVDFSRAVSDCNEHRRTKAEHTPVVTKAVDALRLIVQQTFTALLAATSSVASTAQLPPRTNRTVSSRITQQDIASPTAPTTPTFAPPQQLNPLLSPQKGRKAQPPNSYAFLRILRTLLTRLSSTTSTIASLRDILAQIFSAYTFESSLLDLASGFLDKDVFLRVEEAEQAKRKGWTPRSQGCEECGRRVFGSGLGVGVWEAWKEKTDGKRQAWEAKWGMAADGAGTRARARSDSQAAHATDETLGLRRTPTAREKGKSRATTPLGFFEEVEADKKDANEEQATEGPMIDALVVFACGHAYHRSCLEHKIAEDQAAKEGQHGYRGGHDHENYRCPACHASRDAR